MPSAPWRHATATMTPAGAKAAAARERHLARQPRRKRRLLRAVFRLGVGRGEAQKAGARRQRLPQRLGGAKNEARLHPHWVGGRDGYRHSVLYDGKLLVERSRDPECDAARALLAKGITGTLTLLDGKTGKPRTIIDIEKAAGLETVEGGHGPKLRTQSRPNSPPSPETGSVWGHGMPTLTAPFLPLPLVVVPRTPRAEIGVFRFTAGAFQSSPFD